jgi:hypothetical protein
MAQHLKRWETPRRPGRNRKGRGGSARQRQLMKRRQALRQRLKAPRQDQPPTRDPETRDNKRGEPPALLFFIPLLYAVLPQILNNARRPRNSPRRRHPV